MTDVMPLYVSHTMWLDKSWKPMTSERRTVCSASSTSTAETGRKEKHGAKGTGDAIGDEGMGAAANSGLEGMSR